MWKHTLLLLMMVVGTIGAWGQAPAGIWYLDNKTDGKGYTYNPNDSSANYYLVPAADPQVSSKRDAYYSADYSTTTGNPEQPFITTYKTNKDENSIWFISPSGDGYYFIIHAATGRYLIYEPPHSDAPNRKSMHLQEIDNEDYNPSTNNDFKFAFSPSGGGYTIRPYNVNSGNRFLNVANRNFNNYYGTASGSNNYDHEGIVGLYTSGHIWIEEDASNADFVKPVISDVNTNTNTFTISFPTVSITYPYSQEPENIKALGVTSIIYTTNGDEPTVGGATTLTYTSDVFLEQSGTIKARGVYGNGSMTTVTTKELVSVIVPPAITYNNATGEVTLTTTTPGADIYYTIDGSTEPTSSSIHYTGPFSISGTTTIKAVTIKNGYPSSVTTQTISQVSTPTIQNNGSNAISITCATEGATIYYTLDSSGTPATEYDPSSPLSEGFSNKTIRAIAVKEGMITSAVGSGTVKLKCATPVITRDGMSFAISCSMPAGATIYYTIGSGSETQYANTPVPFTSEDLPLNITAVARHDDYDDSDPASIDFKKGEGTPSDPYLLYSKTDLTNFVNDVNAGTTSSACYKLEMDVSASGISAITTPFTGSFDGGLHTISNLGHALFNSINGGTVKNVILDNVSINSGINVGAICNEATGDSRIYNCGILSGSVGGSGYVGGIVGHLDGSSRVINCYSYATITSGSNVGGIVGYNKYKSKASEIKTMVMNCMFYGDITGGTAVSPVYGGENINNENSGGLNTFNYYAYDKLKTTAITKYNCALAVEEKYLNRIEFYRLLLNSNKKLAAYYATGSVDNADQMAKWVLETADRTISNPKPYPVLKAQGYYPSIINPDFTNAPDSTSAGPNKGGKLGKTLTVNINSVGSNAPEGASITTSSLTLQRTDKDFDRFNFNYDKVQLPYYNDVGTKNYTGNKVVTGWKITAITAVAGDPYTETNYPTSGVKDYPDHNYADRKSSKKDLYSVSKRVFSQGAYFDVPYGVSSITIEPYWGKATYVADNYLDVVSKKGTVNKRNAYIAEEVTQLGQHFPDGKITINDSEQVVYTSISSALDSLNGSTVYDNAVVLVGNLHQIGVPSNGSKAFTMMSVDLDNDHEPDCSFIYCDNDRNTVSPLRFDFLNVPGMAQAQKPNGSDVFLNAAIFRTLGWFEITNTALMYFSQYEYENKKGITKSDAPLILLGGHIDQFVSTQGDPVPGNTIYIHVGSNVLINSFGLGTHSDGSQATPHVPVSVTGGEYKEFYLSGTYNQNAAKKDDNAECYISGGRFGELAGACQEQIGADKSKNNGNVRWQIYNADIDNFYGGGVNDARPVQGNITTDIFYSRVGTFCGGPKFGNMASGKTVTTTAEGCTFDKFFGAGYGGNSYSRKKYFDETTYDWSKLEKYYTGNTGDRGKYYDGTSTGLGKNAQYGFKGPGVATDFDYEFFVWTSGATGARFFVKFASFSLAICNDVSSTLTGCTINENFYGGGSLGKVTGKATSVLDGCTVHGNVFGGGYSAKIPKIPVRNGGFKTNKYPNINIDSGMFEEGELSDSTEYDWQEWESAPSDGDAGTTDGKYVYTNQNLDSLGQVGQTDLIIKGNTYVKGDIHTYSDDGKTIVKTEQTGGVFGGGDMSAVNGNAKVDIQGTATNGINNVFGGGNTADVGGNTQVDMTGGTVSHNVYGGGKGQSTVVSGDVTVNIGAKNETTGALSGTGTIRNVYGGSALGAVNAKKEGGNTVYSGTEEAPKVTTVNIYGCTSIDSIYGGGLGEKTNTSNIPAQNFGDVTVNMEGGTVSKAIYGGSNVNGVLRKNTTVTITGGTVGSSGGDIKNVVFGGGFGEPTLVNGNVEVNIGREKKGSETEHVGTATINGNVYGGGAFGNVNTSKPASTLVFDATKKTNVNLYKGIINGNVFGGGLGRKAVAEPATPGIEAFVGGDVTVTLDGAKLNITYDTEHTDSILTGQIFGANNLNGTPKGHVKVWVKRTVNGDKTTSKTRDERTIYDVAAVYGGGNQADYVPVNATIPLVENASTYKEDSTKVANARAEVIIEGCEKTSINYVYGGGNAAAVPATDVTIKGSYIINTVYGGGNGKGTGNPGANVGKRSGTSTLYGTGKAVTKLLGGYINNVYGGSNTLGDIIGGTDVRTKGKNESFTGEEYCDDLNVGKIYGAGSHADMNSDVNIFLECMPEDFVDQVFGGAELATVNGNVTLTVTSGKFGRVFGGNNAGGDIRGSITVNVYEEGCEPLIIGELYGGGKSAPYSVFGCTKNGDTWTAEESGDSCFNEAAAKRAAIQVNVYSCTSIGRIFGGGMGEKAKVIGNTHVWVNTMKGIVKNVTQSSIGKIGQVFGGGYSALVKGSTLVEIGTETASEDIGVNITRGTYTSETEGTYLDPEADKFIDMAEAGIYGGGYSADVDGDATLIIGTADQKVNNAPGIIIAGSIYGGGYGESTHVTGDVTVNIGGTNESGTPVGYANITGDVYGGSAKGKVNSYLDNNVETASDGKTTQVNLYGGTITGNLYGGGLGEDNTGTENDHAADVYGPVTVNVEGGYVNNVFGSNNVLGSPQSTATVNINGTPTPTTPATYIIENVYGGGNLAAYTGTSGSSVNMLGGYVKNVFGGGLGATAIVNGTTNVTLNGGTVTNDIYGGGSQANVTGAVTVVLDSGTVARDVYGGGALALTNTRYHATDYPNDTTSVTLKGATVTGNLYGGGLGNAETAANVNGPVTVTVSDGYVANVFGCNNINGMPTSTVAVNIKGTGDLKQGMLYAINSVYGGGNVAPCTGSPSVTVSGGHVNYVYGGGLGETAVTGGASVSIEGGSIKNDVYGGGSLADVTGNVSVSVSGGTVTHDVYGGGALANTNTGNWNTSANTWSDTTTDTYYAEVKHLTVGTSSVEGYYTRTGSGTTESPYVYSTTTETGTAVEGKTYCKKLNFLKVAAEGTGYKTTVSLTGGIIGNAYGGGLGRISPAVDAMVYGDVEVTVNGAAFTNDVEYISGGLENVPKHGRVFGCNNLKGTPKGKVTVQVFATKRTDGTNNHVKGEFEIQAVYGGGNLANYEPATYDNSDDHHVEFGQNTSVLIYGCDNTSINKVYGGGNAADVPYTDVTIDGAFEIGYVFGGGNGGDKINKGEGWIKNPGANVDGYTNVMLRGGTIGQAFGGSDTKGTVGGTEVKQESSPGCPLRIVNLYGAGNGDEASSGGDINITVSACGEGSEIQNVFGGSYKANIKGSVTLNITSGIFTSVYGGNDRMGSIGGNITVNIEETDDCSKPIIIQNLYGGCYQTAYPGESDTVNHVPAINYKNDTIRSGKITVNVRSATRIDRIYGGSENGAVTGDTEVNINMARGSQSGHTGVALPNYYVNEESRPSNISNVTTGGYVEVYGLVTNADVLADHSKSRSSVVGYFTKEDTYTQASGTAESGKTYYSRGAGNYYPVAPEAITVGTTDVSGYYTRTGAGTDEDPYIYHNPDLGIAQSGVTYYRHIYNYSPVAVAEDADVSTYYTKTEGSYITATGLAVAGTNYYKESVKGDIAIGIGSIGEVYGGGNRGNVSGNTTVNIGTETTVTMVSLANDSPVKTQDVYGAHITGNVYGGGNLADVKGNTEINICAKKNGSGVYEAVAEGDDLVTIGGDIYGGGCGDENYFTCEKAMVGTDGHGNLTTEGNTSVTIGNGTVSGTVYGGGKIARVENNTTVTIGIGKGVATGTATSKPEIMGSVFGAGKGNNTHGYSALTRGTPRVTIKGNAKVGQSVYGGGEIGSVGRYKVKLGNNNPEGAPADVPVGMPYELKDPVGDPESGKCFVTIGGYAEIGPDDMEMPTFTGHVFGAGKGFLPKLYSYIGTNKPQRMQPGNTWDVFDTESEYITFVETTGMSAASEVTIEGHAFVKGSVYGGSENGHVLNDTHVTIKDTCQVGNGDGKNARYTDGDWSSESASSFEECNHWEYGHKVGGTDENPVKVYLPYDVYNLQADGKTPKPASDGHTFYGNVFGGGSGYFPYRSRAARLNLDGEKAWVKNDSASTHVGAPVDKNGYSDGKWLRSAGSVNGNTRVDILGGHILTNVYGGNEQTDVGKYSNDEYGEPLVRVSGGICTVNMSGGTLGVPRTVEDMKKHPVTCYLFGAGKGDQRINFNTWTNVDSTVVNITGGRIFGSVFGGGEDGHVLRGVKMSISEDSGTTKIGTTGTSYVDGNVFGGGRGFSGEAQTAGTVGGNVKMTISGGTMLGSVYGGGRLASVGTYFTNPYSDIYGQFQEDDGSNTYGHVTVDITGGTIGNTAATGDGAKYSGNVFGGSMGRLTLLNDEINPLWPELAEVKTSTVTISGSDTYITRNVYGGGEYGTVREDATVTISDGAVVDSCVYGGGYGSSNYKDTTTIEVHWGGGNKRYAYTPMQWAGTVGGNTSVSIDNAKVKKNVYGGGELASVGIINYEVDENGKYIDIHKHDTLTDNKNSLYNFGLSWPYEFKYIPCKPNTTDVGGKATVTITNSSTVIGLLDDDEDNIDGFVFGGGKGKVSFGSSANGTDDDIEKHRYIEAFCANVRETDITIGKNDGSDVPQLRTVYGGGEDGHVYQDTKITINNGKITHTVFGGGKGTSTYSGKLLTNSSSPAEYHADSIHSWTAGKVYGNTSVTMKDGSVGWFIYGGGNMASVGKGNYAGGSDDYAPNGYGELPPKNNQALWTNPDAENTYPYYFKHSGNATITILGGKVGPTSGAFSGDADGVPHGSVFGSSRGKAAANCVQSPRYKYVPDFFLGYVNKAVINIGGYIENGDTVTSDGPEIYGSVYGGGQDGHVRNSTEVNIFKGQVLGQTSDTSGRSGNVFGAGSGIGKYKDGSNYYCNNSSGSVTCTTQVHIFGGSVKGSVYGGGALASVGPPNTGTQNGQGFNELNTLDPYTKRPSGFSSAHGSQSYNKVTIEGGTITGSVYGASRGPSTSFLTSAFTGVDSSTDPDKYNPTRYATSIWTEVNIKDHFNEDGTLKSSPAISGSVYGGGEMGQVKESTVVNLTGGSIAHEAYGGGKGTKGTDLSGTNAIAADIGGSTFVELNKGVADNAKGCSVERIFGCNDLNGTPRGHVKVHVHATQNKATGTILDKVAPPDYSTKRDSTKENYIQYLRRILNVVYKKDGEGEILESHELISDRIVNDTITRIEGFYTAMNSIGESSLSKGNKEAITTAAKNVIKEIEKMHDYDVAAVYGGGNLAQYQPYGAAANNTAADYKATTEKTEVIIEGCDVTSIKQVYGGGNAASVPSTDVSVKSVFIIDELFGGGNGFDNYTVDNKWYQNPGANVGYYATEEHITNGSQNGSTEANRFLTKAKPNSSTKEDRITYYSYGSGRAKTTVTGGRIHTVYGGSNEKGNIRTVALSQYQKSGTCPLITDESYGGSKTAEMDGEIQVVMDCVEEGGTYFGGSQNADVNNNVTINITNGTYDKVYGGNNKAGTINGAITINIEEKGCTPIIIGELYGAGYYAPYSVYGYKKDNNGQYVKIKEPDPTNNTDTIYSRIPLQADSVGALTTPHRAPYINIISATSIGKIFGGGDRAKVVGNTHVNVNMQKGIILEEYAKEQTGYSSLTVANGGIDNDGNKILPVGTIGDIYGGGNLADVIGNTYVEIGTGSWYNYETDEIETISRKEAKITGNVFGGGKGKNDTFECEKAMVGHDGGGVTDSEGNTSVIIGNGTIRGNVYGGGEIARVENNTAVTIGLEEGRDTVTIEGYVFGAGQGVATHGYSGLTRGHSSVTVQGKAKVKGSVYGGGEKATVGKYWVNKPTLDDGAPTPPPGTPYGMAYALKSGGKCTVIIRDSAEIGRDNMTMTSTGGPDDWGHVFGAGKGAKPYEGVTGTPYSINGNTSTSADTVKYNTEATYLAFLETLGLASETEVTIAGSAFVKGSVYGGSENGRVQSNTWVKIQDSCQIGNGYVQMDDDGNYLPVANRYSLNRRYTKAEWAAGHLIQANESHYNSSLPECASWEYGIEEGTGDNKKIIYAPYDKEANASGKLDEYPDGTSTEGGRRVASDGHTFYGNVFGGGSGYYPYAAGKWHWYAGYVGGNTRVDITGGHILTNVYGGNEMTNVKGNCTINMSGGTVGVKRTLGQIVKHPVTGYVLGAGMGDPRTFFNQQTNVDSVVVNITGGTIYGSVLGGGEDGHVLGDVDMTISGGNIGTWGTSYVDGNVFGGGRGFAGDALTAGVVSGNVNMDISGGNILGSVYGGGRLGSVGTYLVPTDHANYGKLLPDGKIQTLGDGTVTLTDNEDATHGYITINISGGTIGNTHEYDYIAPTVTGDDLTAAKTNMPNTEHDADNRLVHTKGGNVFAGSMGRLYELDGTTVLPHWPNLGKAKKTKLTISGGTIKSNVYGGGELGAVGEKVNNSFVGGTDITISGGTIGTEITDGEGVTQYTFGSVFGGGSGSKEETTGDNGAIAKLDAGIIHGDTKINMTAGKVLASVYGGGEVASVEDSTNVAISGGTIGKDTVHVSEDKIMRYGGADMGNVYGGGKGDRNIVRAGHIFGNTKVAISGTPKIYHNIYGGGAFGTVGVFTYSYTTTAPGYEGYSKVNGVSAFESGGKAEIYITGGTIGVDGHENGMVFGSSRGEVDAPGRRDDWVAWVNDTKVVVGDTATAAGNPHIKGSVYGGGENGHNFHDAYVRIHRGTIGITDSDGGGTYPYRGNVYGAGCGTDTYKDGSGADKYNPLAGIVKGNTKVIVDGGRVVHNVYGAGAMASVGDATITPHSGTGYVEGSGANEKIYNFGLSWPCELEYAEKTGTATVIISGGEIGVDGEEDANGMANGDVYGSARGEAGDRYEMAEFANVRTTTVTVNGSPTIHGSVYGGGENGHVYEDANVDVSGGTIGHSVFGGGKGMGKYQTTLKMITIDDDDVIENNAATPPATPPAHTETDYTTNIYSITAGKVYGDTYVNISGGSVANNVYGGGNLGSVGKGNYSGGPDDYSTGGYGETLTGTDSLWVTHYDAEDNNSVKDNAYYFLNSGRTYVTVTGGTIGSVDGFKDLMPMGNVFGGCRGMPAPNVTESPRYHYCPEFFTGYVNDANVIIGTAKQSNADAGGTGKAPRIYGSVYGGGQDGHVRRDATVTVYSGEIGNIYNSANTAAVGTDDMNDSQWLLRGNVFGAGSGISMYKYDFNYDGDYLDIFKYGARKTRTPEEYYSTSAGSVTRYTKVDVKGGIIYRNVYGGGSLASVGAPKIGQTYDPYLPTDSVHYKEVGKQSLNEVIIGGQEGGNTLIGDTTSVEKGYGGNVFGASRGIQDLDNYATSIWTKVFVKDGSTILGNVFGGGDNGMVKQDSEVIIGEAKKD